MSNKIRIGRFKSPYGDSNYVDIINVSLSGVSMLHPNIGVCGMRFDSMSSKDKDLLTTAFDDVCFTSEGQLKLKDNQYINDLVDSCHKDMLEAGWWNDPEGNPADKSILPAKVCLIHSELDEALEGIVTDCEDDKLPHRKMEEVELADVVLRTVDYMGARKYRLGVCMGIYATPIPLLNLKVHRKAAIADMHQCATTVMEGLRRGDKVKESGGLYELLVLVYSYAHQRGLELDKAIAEKRAYNKQRADHKPENRAKDGGKKV